MANESRESETFNKKTIIFQILPLIIYRNQIINKAFLDKSVTSSAIMEMNIVSLSSFEISSFIESSIIFNISF